MAVKSIYYFKSLIGPLGWVPIQSSAYGVVSTAEKGGQAFGANLRMICVSTGQCIVFQSHTFTYLATWLEEPCLPQAYSCTLHTSSISATTRCKRNNKSIQGMQHMFYKGYFTLEVSTSSHHVVTLLLIWDVSSVSSLSVNSGQVIHRPIMFGILNPSLPFTFPLE